MTKVLYVEDNDDNVFMLKMRLELLGDFEVLTAEDGEKGCFGREDSWCFHAVGSGLALFGLGSCCPSRLIQSDCRV